MDNALGPRYRHATRVLGGKTKHDLQAAHQVDGEQWAAAAAIVKAEIDAGADARALYQAAERRSHRSRVLLAYLRRGMADIA